MYRRCHGPALLRVATLLAQYSSHNLTHANVSRKLHLVRYEVPQKSYNTHTHTHTHTPMCTGGHAQEKNLTPVSESSGSTPLMSSAFPLACSAAIALFSIHTSIPLNSAREGGEGGGRGEEREGRGYPTLTKQQRSASGGTL